jgi:hypothetical protein
MISLPFLFTITLEKVLSLEWKGELQITTTIIEGGRRRCEGVPSCYHHRVQYKTINTKNTKHDLAVWDFCIQCATEINMAHHIKNATFEVETKLALFIRGI